MAGPLLHPLSATKLRNALKRRARSTDNLDISIKNVRINGQLRGCSGFITNSDTGAIAYVNVESDPDSTNSVELVTLTCERCIVLPNRPLITLGEETNFPASLTICLMMFLSSSHSIHNSHAPCLAY